MAIPSPVTSDDKTHYNAKIVWTVLRISLGAVTFGYTGAIIGTTLGQPSFVTYMALDSNKHAASLTGSVVGLFYAGGVFGCILNSVLADRIGRKRTVAVAGVIQVISTACLAGSVNIAMFIVFRFFVGLSAYMLYLTCPLWVTELSPAKGRSVLGGIVGLGGVIGYIIASYVGVGFFYFETTTASQWRGPLAIGCLPPLLLTSLVPWLPESPRWLLKADHSDQAWETIRALHTRRDDPNHELAQAEFYQMRKQHDLDVSLDSSWAEVLRRPSYRDRALIVFCLPIILFSTGDLVVATYAASIFSGLGFDASQSIQLLAGLNLSALLGNVISLSYVDRVPRNKILGLGVATVTIILSIETALQANYLGTLNHTGLAVAASFLFLFLFSFNIFGLESISWYYAAEIFPTHLRAKGMTIAAVGFCLVDVLWLELAPTAFATISWKYYIVFICLSVFGAAAIYFLFPNTLQMPLQEVAKLFGDEDLVAIYQRDIKIDEVTHQVIGEKSSDGDQAPDYV